MISVSQALRLVECLDLGLASNAAGSVPKGIVYKKYTVTWKEAGRPEID
jgi:hypothetical protein